MDNKDKVIKDAQYRKGLSIAFFNATNSAISLVSAIVKENDETMLQAVIKYRDFFLQEYTKYYSETIANIGVAYDIKATIEKLQATKNLEELKDVWLSISADERHDETIINAKKQLKEKHENIQRD